MTFGELNIGDRFCTIGVITRNKSLYEYEKKIDQIEAGEATATNAVAFKNDSRKQKFFYFSGHDEVEKIQGD